MKIILYVLKWLLRFVFWTFSLACLAMVPVYSLAGISLLSVQLADHAFWVLAIGIVHNVALGIFYMMYLMDSWLKESRSEELLDTKL